jgi:hypothetical protein
VAILWRPTNDTLKWSDTPKSYGGLNVHKINNSGDSFSPELRRKRRQVTMPEQSQEGDDAYAQQHCSEHEDQCTNTEEEYPARKETDKETEINTHRQSHRERQSGTVKLSVNHHSKCLIGSKHMSSRLQEIDPCEAREIIN